MFVSRLRSLVSHPAFWTFGVWVLGIALRLEYTLRFNRPENFVYADMELYVSLAKRLLHSKAPLQPWDVTHPLGYPALMAFLMSGGGSLANVMIFQIVVSSLVPLAIGLLAVTAYGRRAGMLAVVFASLYFPFIEFGALFLSEIHFIFWMAIAFACFFGSIRARGRMRSLGLAAAGGLTLSIAIALKSVALLAALTFFAVEAIAIVVRPSSQGLPPLRQRLTRLKPWLLRCLVVALAAAPLLGTLARVCTRANRGNFCVTGNKVGADFLLGHYGRIADIEWPSDGRGPSFRFGSLSAHLRHYEHHAKVPFPLTDSAANKAEAWRWIKAHPVEAIVLSLDHVYDAFFGPALWPSHNHWSWMLGQVSQYLFLALLFVPTLFALREAGKGGLRAFLTSRTLLVFSPILSIAATVAIATGEIRYRIPFDMFFISIVAAYAVRDPADAGANTQPSPGAATATTDLR
jgi:hypothetical protein